MHAFSPSTSKLHASGVLCLLSRQLISWRIQCPSLINYLCMEFINDAIGVCVETSILPTLQGRTFAFVTFKDAAAAAAVVETGHITITAPAAGGEVGQEPKEEEISTPTPPAPPPQPCRVQPAKFSCKEVLVWRSDIRSKFAEVKKARDALPSADPTEQCNAGNNFRAMYGNMVVTRKD